MADSDGEYIKLKESFKDIMETFNLHGKSQSQIIGNGSLFKRDVLAEAVTKLIGLCEKTFGMYDKAIKSHPNVSDIVGKVKLAMNEIVPSLVTNALQSNVTYNAVQPVNNGKSKDEDKHVIVIEDKQDDNKKYDKESWSEVVQSSLSSKLKNIPVHKSLVTKSGQGCLIFPTKNDQEQAQLLLEQEYKVSLTTQQKRQLLPKLKICRINHSYKKQDKDVLKMAIQEKNSSIDAYIKDGHTFEIIIIDEQYHYAVVKTSPEIRNAVMEKGSIFLDMESLEVRDHFHVIQCFSCQEFGHKKGDDVCKNKNNSCTACLYCGGNHESKGCGVKRDSSKWNCSNCSSSSNPRHRQNANHTSTSSCCPFVIQQVKSLINRTQGLDVKNYFQ